MHPCMYGPGLGQNPTEEIVVEVVLQRAVSPPSRPSQNAWVYMGVHWVYMPTSHKIKIEGRGHSTFQVFCCSGPALPAGSHA